MHWNFIFFFFVSFFRKKEKFTNDHNDHHHHGFISFHFVHAFNHKLHKKRNEMKRNETKNCNRVKIVNILRTYVRTYVDIYCIAKSQCQKVVISSHSQIYTMRSRVQFSFFFFSLHSCVHHFYSLRFASVVGLFRFWLNVFMLTEVIILLDIYKTTFILVQKKKQGTHHIHDWDNR